MSMFVALDPNGQLITIENTMRGLACNCTCASCGEPVVARKGLIREHHFSHHSNKESCFISAKAYCTCTPKKSSATSSACNCPQCLALGRRAKTKPAGGISKGG